MPKKSAGERAPRIGRAVAASNDDTATDDSGDSGALPNSSPYASGTCFNGPYITSTTPIDPTRRTERTADHRRPGGG